MKIPFSIDIFEELATQKLPGHKSHKEVMSHRRETVEHARTKTPKPRDSSVLALFYPRQDDWYVALTKRNSYDGTHSGQVSLPGGKIEEGDADLKQTALRETNEEIGIASTDITIVKELTQLYIPPSNFIVTPYMAYTESSLTFIPDPREVERVLELPIKRLVDNDFLGMEQVSVGPNNLKISVKALRFENEIIWGATAMILNEIRSLLLTVV